MGLFRALAGKPPPAATTVPVIWKHHSPYLETWFPSPGNEVRVVGKRRTTRLNLSPRPRKQRSTYRETWFDSVETRFLHLETIFHQPTSAFQSPGIEVPHRRNGVPITGNPCSASLETSSATRALCVRTPETSVASPGSAAAPRRLGFVSAAFGSLSLLRATRARRIGLAASHRVICSKALPKDPPTANQPIQLRCHS
jgi:hypothetical protein